MTKKKILALQNDTLKTQQKVTNLETRKFLYDIRPVFELFESKLEPMINNGFNVSLEIRLLKNVARDYYIVNKSEFMSSYVYNFSREYIPIESKFFIFKGNLPSKYVNNYLTIEVYFSDEIGTEYYQIISNSFAAPQITPPFLVKDRLVGNVSFMEANLPVQQPQDN